MSGFGFGTPQQQTSSFGFGASQQQQQPAPFGSNNTGFGVSASPGSIASGPVQPFGSSGPSFGSSWSANPGPPTGFGTSPNVVGGFGGAAPAVSSTPTTLFAPPASAQVNNAVGFGMSSGVGGFGQPTNAGAGVGFSSAPSVPGFGSASPQQQQQQTTFGAPGFGASSNTGFGMNNNSGFGSGTATANTAGFGTSSNTGFAGANSAGFGSSNNSGGGFGVGSSSNNNSGFGFGNTNNSSSTFNAPGAFGNAPPTSPFGVSNNSSNTFPNPFGSATNTAAAPAVSFGMSSNVVTNTNAGFSNNRNNNSSTFRPSQTNETSYQSSNPFGNGPTSATTFSPSTSHMNQQSDHEIDMADGNSGGFGSTSAPPQSATVWQRPHSNDPHMHDANTRGGISSPVPEGDMVDGNQDNDAETELSRLKAKLAEKKKKLMESKLKKKSLRDSSELSNSPSAVGGGNSEFKNYVPSKKSEETNALLPSDLKRKGGERGGNDDGDDNQDTEIPRPVLIISREDHVREDLATAVSLVGTCTHMCPDEELLRRETEGDIQLLEIPKPGLLHPAHWTLRDTVVKRFRRSAADFKLDVPEWVRPPDTLEKVCSYLEEWVMDRDRQGPDPRFSQQKEQTPPSLDVYQFIWDRTRMVRKDFILQNYVGTGGKCDARAVRCHERIARWHAMCEHQLCHLSEFVTMQSQQNIQELGQTMKTLNQYYDDSLNRALVEVPDDEGKETRTADMVGNFSHGCASDFVQGTSPVDYDGRPLSNDSTNSSVSQRLIGKDFVNSPTHGTAEPEMRGLYILLTMNNDGGMEVLKFAGRLFRERPEVYHSAPVQLALSIYKAKKDYNYVRFFSILRDPATPYLFSCIMFKHVELMRKAAFRIMSKTYGAKQKDGEPIYDAYPLKKLEKILCFEDLDEARDACKHYNITVKTMKIRSSSPTEQDSSRIEDIIQWRHSAFKEPKHPEKGTVVILRAKKMVKSIESKLNGATRLAVCRGEVSGEGATLSRLPTSSTAEVVIEPENETEAEKEARMLKEEDERRRKAQEEADAKLAAKRAEILKRQIEAKQKKEEERLRLQKEDEEREAERRRLEIEEKNRIEEQQRREAEQKRLEEERKKRELELKIRREKEERERLKMEQLARAAKEEQMRKEAEQAKERQRLLAEAARRKAEQEAREKELEERRRREEERQRLIIAERERQLREEAERKRKLDEAERKKKEEHEKRIALELERKIEKARKLLTWRRWRQRLPRKKYNTELSRKSLGFIDPTFAIESNLIKEVFSDPLDPASKAMVNETSLTHPRTDVSPVCTRRVLERILSEPPTPFDLTNLLVDAIQENQEKLIKRRRDPKWDNMTTILFKIAILLPEFCTTEEEGMCELVHGWLNSRLKYDETVTVETYLDCNSGYRQPCNIRVVFVSGCSGREASVCDMALFVIPPPWTTSGWTSTTKDAISGVFSRIDSDIPLVSLVLGEDVQAEYFDSARRFLSACKNPENSTITDHEFPIIFPSSVSKTGIDGALETSCRVLVDSFLGESYPPLLERISVTKLGCMCICDALWKNNGLASRSIHNSFPYADFARATLNVMVTELEEVGDSLKADWQDWPADTFAERDSDNVKYVNAYFGENGHLPMTWLSSFARSNTKSSLMHLFSSFHGPVASVVEKLLIYAPLSILQECETMVQKQQYRRCIHRMLMYWAESCPPSDQAVYLPTGWVDIVLNNTVEKVVNSIGDLVQTSAWQRSRINDGGKNDTDNFDTITIYTEDEQLVSAKGSDDSGAEHTATFTGNHQIIDYDVHVLTSPAPTTGVISSNKRSWNAESTDDVNTFNLEDENAVVLQEESPRIWAHEIKTKRRRHSSDNNLKPMQLSRDLEESSAFTKKLEALLHGNMTIDMKIGETATLAEILRDVPPLEY